MSTDKDRVDWLEKQVLASGYGTELIQGTNLPFDRVILKTAVGSGPWQKSYSGYNLRYVIDKAMYGVKEHE